MRDRERESLLGEITFASLDRGECRLLFTAVTRVAEPQPRSPGSCVTRIRAGWRGARVCGEQTEKALLIHYRQRTDVALSAGIARIIVIFLLVYVV